MSACRHCGGLLGDAPRRPDSEPDHPRWHRFWHARTETAPPDPHCCVDGVWYDAEPMEVHA